VASAPAPGGRAIVSNGWLTVTPLPAGGQPSIAFGEFGEGPQPAIDLAGLVYAEGTLWIVASAKRLVVAVNPYAINTGFANTSTGIRVGHAPADIAYGAGSLWVDSHGDGTVAQIDPASQRVIRTIHLGYRPAGLATGAGAVWATARGASATAAATGLLAFDDHGQVYTSRPDGSHRRRLTHSHWPLQDIEPAWSPDGRQIAFLRVRGDKENEAYPYTPMALWVMNADGGRQRAIPHTGDAVGSAPAWSPDGTKIAFDAGSSSGINTIEIDGRHRHRMGGALVDGDDPAWSPDGTHIGFDSNFHTSDSNDYQVFTSRLDGTHLRRVTSVLGAYMQWSPDGHRIVYNRYRPDGAYLGEFITPASGGPGLRLLPPTNRYAGALGGSVVSWSPDGAAIAVSGMVTQFTTHPAIYVANSDGTGLTLVARGNDAVWSPVP
jgi:dipeptidyl aminopeptidase/acylaminoacyl peptidase